MVPPSTQVVRDKRQTNTLASKVVPGDLIFVRTGDKIPVDAIVIQASELKVNQANLTGESDSMGKMPCMGSTPKPVLVSKIVGNVPQERDAMKEQNKEPMESPYLIFAGTVVVSGSYSSLLFLMKVAEY